MGTKEVTVSIIGGPPYGMTIKGGVDCDLPITIENIRPGSKSEASGLKVGDEIISINSENVQKYNHDRTRNLISSSGNLLVFTVKRVLQPGENSVDSQVTFPQQTTTPAPQNTPNTSKPPPINITSTPTPLDFSKLSDSSNKSSLTNVTNIPQSQPSQSVSGSSVGLNTSQQSVDSKKDDSQVKLSYQPVNQDNNNLIPVNTPAAGICEKCKEQIGSKNHVKLGNKVWHTDHFSCHICQANIADDGFFEEGGNNICSKCYENIYAKRCAKCTKPLIGPYVSTSGKSFHQECFKCAKCNKLLAGQSYSNHENENYCKDCISEILSLKCHACSKNIEPNQQYLGAMGFNFHTSCFRCAECNEDLTKLGKFALKSDKPVCPTH